MIMPIPRQTLTIKKIISKRLKKNLRIPENPLLNMVPRNIIIIKRLNAIPNAYKNLPYMIFYHKKIFIILSYK